MTTFAVNSSGTSVVCTCTILHSAFIIEILIGYGRDEHYLALIDEHFPMNNKLKPKNVQYQLRNNIPHPLYYSFQITAIEAYKKLRREINHNVKVG